MSESAPRYGRDTFDAFEVLPWEYDSTGDVVTLHYRLGPHEFAEAVRFGVSGSPPPQLVDLLAVLSGVSYFKAAAPRVLRSAVSLGPAGRAVIAAAYDHGLREFAFRNALDVPLSTTLEISHRSTTPAPAPAPAPAEAPQRRTDGTDVFPLVTLGGGRDSALTAAVLAEFGGPLMTVGPNAYADRIGEHLGRTVHHASRRIDPLLIELNRGAALNGHVPITGINSVIAAISASMLGCSDVVMSNEASANTPSHVTAHGDEINHQYSKSWAFERLLASALREAGGPRYFSAIRPWGELAVSRAFAAARSLHPLVMSCNRAFVRDPALRSNGWCGACDKCRFVFLSLAPFMEPAALSSIFGRDLLATPSVDDIGGFAALFAERERPWDCVGSPGEVRLALGLLVRSTAWRDHTGVIMLATRFGAPPIDDLAATFAAHGDHAIPAPYLALMESAFGS